MSSKRFPNYQPSTALRQAITRYREALAASAVGLGQSVESAKDPDGRAQLEVDAARDTPGTGAAEGGATRRSELGEGGAHD